MKIDSIDTVRHREYPNLIYVQVHTDDGLTGLGEAFYGAEGVEAHIHAAAAPLLLGADPLRTEAHNVALAGYVGYAGSGTETRARSAVDMALWDIRGQAAGMPLYDLMGGATRASIPIYNTCAGSRYVRQSGQSSRNWGLDAESGRYEDLQRFLTDAGDLAAELLDEGFHGMKIWPFDTAAEATGGNDIDSDAMRVGLRPVQLVREAVGDRLDLMIELHALWNVPSARRIVGALAEYAPYWIEDPVRADVRSGLEAVGQVTTATNTMLAAGETIGSLSEFAGLLTPGPVDVATLDVGWCGGITPALKIAALAAAGGKAIAPHDCTGPVALAVATHLSMSAPNALRQETVRAATRGWYQDIVTELPPIDGGRISAAQSPGLGTTLQEEFIHSSGAIVHSS